MMSFNLICLLVLAAAVQGMESVPHQREHPENAIDGYVLATVHTVDSATNQVVGRNKRDIEALAEGSSKRTPILLDLATGERLNMSLFRRSVDTSGGKVLVIDEDGSEREVDIDSSDCFFSGPMQDQEGFANLALCDGELMGSISTDKRLYEIHTLPHYPKLDVMRVLVTWRNMDHGSVTNRGVIQTLQDKIEDGDALEITEEDDDDEEPEERIITRRDSRRVNREKKRITVEIADVLDEHYVNALNERGISKDKKIIKFILNKWSGAASILSNREALGWDITLKLVALHIWRKNPTCSVKWAGSVLLGAVQSTTWYKSTPTDHLINRMRMVCRGFRNDRYDQITLHTGDPIIPKGKMGLGWVNGVCKSTKCTSSRSLDSIFHIELHELGHSLGFNHDNLMPECQNDEDRVPGFMGSYQDRVRHCYKEILEKLLRQPEKMCLYKQRHQGKVKKF